MKAVSLIVSVGFIVVIIPAFFLLRGDSEWEITNYPAGSGSVVALGDSLVEGIGATDGNDFVSLLSREIDEPIVNLGKAGDTTASALARIDEVLDEGPKIVLVLLGGNDFIRRVPKEAVLDNLASIIEAVQNDGAIVVLLGIRGGILRDGYEKDYQKLAKEHGTAYVSNVLDGLIGDIEFMYDSLHPNDKGYRIIANRVLPILQKLLE